MRETSLSARALLLYAALCCAGAPVLRAQTAASAAIPPRAPAAIAPAEKLSLAGISNAGRVNESLFRGAQPRPDGYDQLKRLGISLVVDLHNRGNELQRERAAVEARGMRYVSIPAGAFHGPTLEQIAEFLLLLRNNPKEKFFVHCQRGADRTGVMIAAFRMAEQHWTPEQARSEMLNFHFRQFWLPSMSHTVRDFPKNFETSPAFSALRPPEQTR